MHAQAVFSINELNGMTMIPAGVGIALPGSIAPALDFTVGPDPDNKDDWPHFECYAIEEYSPGREVRLVKLRDQFGTVKHKVARITQLCAPVDKNEEGMPNPEFHLVCYEILEGHNPNLPVETDNQFGKAKMQVLQAQELCVPSTKKVIYEEEKKEQYKQ